MVKVSHKQAVIFLAKKDPVLKGLFRQISLRQAKPKKNHFASLARAIIGQQLSTKAASTIAARFCKLFGSADFPSPKQVLNISSEKMRDAGLSFQKIKYLKNLAQATENKNLDFKKMLKLADEQIIEMLVEIKGIGRWTAEMFLMFSLARPNVFSAGDLGLKNAVKKFYNIDLAKHPAKFNRLLELWHPHKTTAARCLWAALALK